MVTTRNDPLVALIVLLPRSSTRVENLSLSGTLMKADADLRLHSLIEVSIKLPPLPARQPCIAQLSQRLLSK
jgi:hypothetical protein